MLLGMRTLGVWSRVGLTLSLLSASCGAPGVETNEVSVQYAPIINGTRETGRKQVVLVVNRAKGGLCTGSVVADRVVLTAKHCVQDPDATAPLAPRSLGVGIGSSLSFGGGGDVKWLSVAEIATTPGGYSEGSFGVEGLAGEDVAVITLTGSAGVAPLKLKLTDPKDEIGARATAVGFGQTPKGDVGVKYTVETKVQNIDDETIEVDGTVCQGDSGGPLINQEGAVFGVVSFGTSQGCGGGPSFYQRIDIWADLIMGAIKKSGVCSDDGVEACDGFDNDCDDKIDEDCLDVGKKCSSDSQCLSRFCTDTTEGKICTVPCDPLSPDRGCDQGFFCASTATCEGICVPGKVGPKRFGETCEDNVECASLFCDDPGDGLKRCLVACRGGDGDCLSGEACVAASGQCGSCIDSDLINGKLGLDEPCNKASDCQSGVCFDDGGTSYCAAACSTDRDCSAEHHCREGVCARGPRQGLGGACKEHEDCTKGFFCAKAPQGQFCTRECAKTTPCGDGFECKEVNNGSICIPEKPVLGGPCASDADCTSGSCHEKSGTCTRQCVDATSCGVGFECVRVTAGGGVCLTPEAAATDPNIATDVDAATAGDMVKKDDDSGCSAALGGRAGLGGALWLAALTLGFAARRRRAV